MRKSSKQEKRKRLIDLSPDLRRIRDELDVLSLRVVVGRRDEEDDSDERHQRRLDVQEAVDKGWSRIVGAPAHAASAGDIRSLVASLSNVLDLLRVLKVQS